MSDKGRARPQGRSMLGLPRGLALACAALFAVAFVVYLWLWPEAPVMSKDSPLYLDVARDLADGRLDSLHDRAPGYPLLILLTGSQQAPTRALFWLALALHLGCIWVLAVVLRAAGVRPALLVLFALFFLAPFSVQPATYLVMSEGATQLSLVAGVAALAGWCWRGGLGWLVAGALALALSGLIRPSHQFVSLAAASALLALAAISAPGARPSRRSLIGAGALVVGLSVLVTGSFSWLNYQRFGYFGISPSLGFALSTRTVTVLERIPDQDAEIREALIQARDNDLVRRGGDHTGLSYAYSGVVDEIQRRTGLARHQVSGRLAAIFVRLIAAAPLHYLSEVSHASMDFWLPAHLPDLSGRAPALRPVWTGMHFIFIGLFALQFVVVLGIALLRAGQRLAGGAAAPAPPPASAPERLATAVYLLSLAVILYTLVISCTVAHGDSRYRVPVDMLIGGVTLLGVERWARLSRQITWRAAPQGAVSG